MKTILIADPDPAARKALTLILKHRFGMEQVHQAGDIETLIRVLDDCPPEMLLLDWELYGAPAPETCRLLHKAYPTLKIILLSANSDDVNAACKADAVFIHKGAAPEQLIATLMPLLDE